MKPIGVPRVTDQDRVLGKRLVIGDNPKLGSGHSLKMRLKVAGPTTLRWRCAGADDDCEGRMPIADQRQVLGPTHQRQNKQPQKELKCNSHERPPPLLSFIAAALPDVCNTTRNLR